MGPALTPQSIGVVEIQHVISGAVFLPYLTLLFASGGRRPSDPDAVLRRAEERVMQVILGKVVIG
jgi:hypothetical protein